MSSFDQGTIELMRLASTASITGYLYKKHGMRMRAIAGISPLSTTRCRFVGPAFTMRYVPQRDGTFRPEPVGTNELSESVAAIFGTMRHVRLAETSEGRLAFEALDIDGNGLLVPSETAGFGEQMQAADSNGDGGVDFEEFELIDRL